METKIDNKVLVCNLYLWTSRIGKDSNAKVWLEITRALDELADNLGLGLGE